MQNDLNALIKWSDLWMMPFNKDKGMVLHIGSTNKGFSYTLGDFTLASTKIDKDLGVQVDDGLKFRERRTRIVSSVKGYAAPGCNQEVVFAH